MYHACCLLLFLYAAELWSDAVTDTIYCSEESNATCRINHLFSNDCSRSDLGNRFPGLYNDEELHTESIDTFLVGFIRRNQKLGFVLEIRPSLHTSVQPLEGYEILMTNVTERSTECFILVFASNMSSSNQKTSTVKTILFPVVGINWYDSELKSYVFKASSLPASGTNLGSAKYVYVNAGDSTEASVSQYFIASIAYINDSNTRSIYVNFERPPVKFGFTHLSVKLRNNGTSPSQHPSVKVSVKKPFCQFIDLLPGQYTIEVEPETNITNYMHCQDRSGFQQMCSITSSEPITLRDPENLSVSYDKSLEYRTTSTAREYGRTFQSTTFLVPNNASGHLDTYSFQKEDSNTKSSAKDTMHTTVILVVIVTVVGVTTTLSIVFFCRMYFGNRKRHTVGEYDHTSVGHVTVNGVTLNNDKIITTAEEQWELEQDQYLKEKRETVQVGIFLIDDDDTICNPSIYPAETILAVNMDELNHELTTQSTIPLERMQSQNDHNNKDFESFKPVETTVCSEAQDFVPPEASQMDDIDSQRQIEQIVDLNRRYMFHTANTPSFDMSDSTVITESTPSFDDISDSTVRTAEQRPINHTCITFPTQGKSHQSPEHSDDHFSLGNNEALDLMMSSTIIDNHSRDYGGIICNTYDTEYDQSECSQSLGGLSV